MSTTLQNLPKFFRLPDSSISDLPITTGAIYFAPDKGKLYLDSDDSRVDLSPVRVISTAEDLPATSTGHVYITNSGNLFINVGGNWYEYSPVAAGEATYMYRFEVTNRESELSFSSDILGVSHSPEFELLDADYNNISGSDWLTRGWVDDSYVLKASGGFPDGTYYLKISYNVRNDASGVYIQDDTSTAASIKLSAGEHYIFTSPLTSLSVDTDSSCRGIATLQFTTGDSFTFLAASGLSYTNSVPSFKSNTTYYISSQNCILTVSEVVSQ